MIRDPLTWPSFDPGDFPEDVIYNPDGSITYVMSPGWDQGRLMLGYTEALHPRGRGGRWSKTGRGLFSLLLEHEGFSYQPVSGDLPTKGFAVATKRGAEFTLDPNTMSRQEMIQHINAYMQEHKDAFDDPDVHAGAWYDPESGDVFLDLSTLVNSREEAVALGKEHGQLGVFDLSKPDDGFIETLTWSERKAWERAHGLSEETDSVWDVSSRDDGRGEARGRDHRRPRQEGTAFFRGATEEALNLGEWLERLHPRTRGGRFGRKFLPVNSLMGPRPTSVRMPDFSAKSPEWFAGWLGRNRSHLTGAQVEAMRNNIAGHPELLSVLDGPAKLPTLGLPAPTEGLVFKRMPSGRYVANVDGKNYSIDKWEGDGWYTDESGPYDSLAAAKIGVLEDIEHERRKQEDAAYMERLSTATDIDWPAVRTALEDWQTAVFAHPKPDTVAVLTDLAERYGREYHMWRGRTVSIDHQTGQPMEDEQVRMRVGYVEPHAIYHFSTSSDVASFWAGGTSAGRNHLSHTSSVSYMKGKGISIPDLRSLPQLQWDEHDRKYATEYEIIAIGPLRVVKSNLDTHSPFSSDAIDTAVERVVDLPVSKLEIKTAEPHPRALAPLQTVKRPPHQPQQQYWWPEKAEANRLKDMISNQLPGLAREPGWNGTLTDVYMDGAIGVKSRDCSINVDSNIISSISEEVGLPEVMFGSYALTHELLHSFSAFEDEYKLEKEETGSQLAYNAALEEGVVDLLSRTLIPHMTLSNEGKKKLTGLIESDASPYNRYVHYLRRQAARLKVSETELAISLMNVPLSGRKQYLVSMLMEAVEKKRIDPFIFVTAIDDSEEWATGKYVAEGLPYLWETYDDMASFNWRDEHLGDEQNSFKYEQ
jgi:hypothetical protein